VAKLQGMYKIMKSKRPGKKLKKSRISGKKNDPILNQFAGKMTKDAKSSAADLHNDAGSDSRLNSNEEVDSSDDEAPDFDEEDEEQRIAKDKLERYMAELANNPTPTTNAENEHDDEEPHGHENLQVELYNSKKHASGDRPVTPDNSSDEEVYRNFHYELMNLLSPNNSNRMLPNVNELQQKVSETAKRASPQTVNDEIPTPLSNEIEKEPAASDVNNNKNGLDSLFPKSICWNQNSTTLFLTITLTSVVSKAPVTDFQINYSPTFMSFRYKINFL
jgi:hypothetical protein